MDQAKASFFFLKCIFYKLVQIGKISGNQNKSMPEDRDKAYLKFVYKLIENQICLLKIIESQFALYKLVEIQLSSINF